ncbi:hypothetical protein GYMLUDRAFT_767560 [Collybiopsis luxurians FD-317 M1]|uniref:Uncharacterized protein n=1 Tax=Collybiopsis luxurians FD-317 M1 TaxID=944289 RepID=A0A0D0B272_9AGAR|nr:hypothetical protein GYMLUDRAFT_767560 [Collybiopsis luxurians FD-317 M1]
MSGLSFTVSSHIARVAYNLRLAHSLLLRDFVCRASMCDLGLEIWNALFNVLQRHPVYTDFYDACVRLNASHLLEHIMEQAYSDSGGSSLREYSVP